jgi:glycosyltransferase involved in cell wall biosynthesis
VDVLVVTNLLPGERHSGGEIVTQNVVDALFAVGLDARVLAYSRPGDVRPGYRGERSVGVRPIETREAGVRALGWGLRALATRAPYSTTKWISRGYLRAVREALGERPSAVIVDHAGMHGVAAPALATDTPLVFLAHNAEAEMYASVARLAGRAGRLVYARESRLIRAVESELAARARQVWTLTEGDAGYFRSLRPGADVRQLLVASSLDEPPEPVEPSCDVALIGTWTWHANAEGLRWFAEEVLPSLGDLTVEVAGRGGDWLGERHPNVTVRGVVPDAREFMSAARVVAVPSTAGGGVQVKTLDAIACGLPVVATGVATRGLDGLPEWVAVADDPAEFARELRRLAADPEPDRIRAAALAWSRARRERFAADVVSWMGELS